ncbi:MAG: zinc ribbon domain-containing protein [Halieaceae bacterium]|jgi:putative FmdB family regulatory protein|nr:MAG: zinc ribbon domain-containing protein [Halieaceae bacterium]
MPIYEYQCQECGHELEAIQRLADDPLTECPACGKQGLKKRVSAPSFRLSGGGWYETDFKTGDKKNIAGERNDTAAKAAASSDSGSTSGDATTKSATKEAPPKKSDTSSAS